MHFACKFGKQRFSTLQEQSKVTYPNHTPYLWLACDLTRWELFYCYNIGLSLQWLHNCCGCPVSIESSATLLRCLYILNSYWERNLQHWAIKDLFWLGVGLVGKVVSCFACGLYDGKHYILLSLMAFYWDTCNTWKNFIWLAMALKRNGKKCKSRNKKRF